MNPPRAVRLSYELAMQAQAGHDLDHPLFAMLRAVRSGGSIQQAAQQLGVSYRHLWGRLKAWEQAVGAPLVTWVRGQPAQLTPHAERLVQAEERVRERMAPHLQALRHELEQVFEDVRADGGKVNGPP